MFKILPQNVLTGEGNLYNIMKENRCKFSWGINSLTKDFQNRKNCSANFLQWGEACVVPFTVIVLVGMQTSEEQRDSARSDQRPVRVCMMDHFKSAGAINREEVYLRGTF